MTTKDTMIVIMIMMIDYVDTSNFNAWGIDNGFIDHSLAWGQPNYELMVRKKIILLTMMTKTCYMKLS